MIPNRPVESAGDASKAVPEPGKPAFEFWDFPGEAVVREPPPTSISDADRSRLEELLRAGTDSSTTDGDELFIILGLDFGTSSTKMIVRLPYEAGEPTIAIPAPAFCRSDDDPYLWQTVLWLRKDGSFRLYPEAGAMALNSLKQGLIQGRSETAISSSEATFSVSRAQAGVGYLSFVIRYVRGWLLCNRRDLFRARNPVWFVHLGMPAASYDDLELAKPYRRVGAAALQLAKGTSPITVETAQRFLNDPTIEKAGTSPEAAQELGIAVFPEAAAEMTAFAKSTRYAPGLYLLVDVGAMTLDVCMFRLTHRFSPDGNASDHYLFMATQIRPLGVESFHWFLDKGKTTPEFVEQCERALRAVVWHTKKKRDPNAECWTPGNDVPVFLTGGGAANHLHRNVLILDFLNRWLINDAANDGIRLIELPVPTAINLPDPPQDLGRMAVAWGLSYPDIGQIHPECSIHDIPPPPIRDITDLFISKDLV